MNIKDKVKKNIKETGYSIIYVGQGENTPSFSYTIGLSYSLNHRELLIFGLPQEYALEILNSIAKKIKSDGPLSEGEVLQKIANFHLIAMNVDNNISDQYAFLCNQFYCDEKLAKPLFSIIYWPDENGIFPWEHNFNKNLRSIQPQLSSTH